jgi:hypothetical protein
LKDGAPLAENSVTLDHAKAQYFSQARSARRIVSFAPYPGFGWSSGTYSAVVNILRDGKPVIDETRTFDLD